MGSAQLGFWWQNSHPAVDLHVHVRALSLQRLFRDQSMFFELIQTSNARTVELTVDLMPPIKLPSKPSAPSSARSSGRPPRQPTPKGGRPPTKKINAEKAAVDVKENVQGNIEVTKLPLNGLARRDSTGSKASARNSSGTGSAVSSRPSSTERRGISAPAVAAIARAVERRNSKDLSVGAPAATSVLGKSGVTVQDMSAEMSTTVMSIELERAIHSAAVCIRWQPRTYPMNLDLSVARGPNQLLGRGIQRQLSFASPLVGRRRGRGKSLRAH